MSDDLYMDAHLLHPEQPTTKHSHYFKSVIGLSEVDVYRVCDLFKVNDSSGAIQHAIKKLLLPGERGAGKGYEKDLQEAIDSIQRKLNMLKENSTPTEGPRRTIKGMSYTVSEFGCHTMKELDTLQRLGAVSILITPALNEEINKLRDEASNPVSPKGKAPYEK